MYIMFLTLSCPITLHICIWHYETLWLHFWQCDIYIYMTPWDFVTSLLAMWYIYIYMTPWDFVIHFWQCPNWDGNAWPSQCHMKVFESQPHSHGFLSGINEIRNHPSHLVRPPYAVINAHLSASYLRDLIESLIVKQWVCFEFGHSLKQRNRRELELGCEGSTLWKSLVGGK